MGIVKHIHETARNLSKAEIFRIDRRVGLPTSDRIKKLIKYIEDKTNIRFVKMNNLGKGAFGDVYKVNNKAVKFTYLYKKEKIDFLSDVMQEKPKGFIEIYQVISVPKDVIDKEYIGVIVMEILQSKTSEIEKFLSVQIDEEYIYQVEGMSRHWIENLLDDAFTQKISTNKWNHLKPLFERYDEEYNTTFFTDMWSAGWWLLKTGHEYIDLHSGNVMYDPKSKEYKLIDIA
jgi:hypothetical protein